MKTISFIGGGRIAKIMLQAFENAGIAFEKTAVYDINPDALKAIKAKFSHVNTTENLEDVLSADLIFLATHPPVTVETLEKIKGKLNSKAVLVSLVPKINIQKTIAVLENFTNVARMNPSASTIVNKGVNPIAFASNFDSEKKEALMKLLHPIGYTPEIDDAKIEAYAVISAMGHTYFFFQMQKLKELAIGFGMNEKEAEITIGEMLKGSVETMFHADLAFSEVDNLVPVKPLGEAENTIKGFYDQYLPAIFAKIKS